MSWSYLGLDVLYDAVASLYHYFLSKVSSLDPRYLLTAGSSSAVSTITQHPASSNGIVMQAIHFGADKVATLFNAISSVPMGIFNLLRGNTAHQGIRLLGPGEYPLATIPQASSSTTGALIQAVQTGVENHPYLATGCALAVAGGVLIYKYSGTQVKEEHATPTQAQTPRKWRSIRKTEEAELMAEAQRFMSTTRTRRAS